MKHPLDEPKPFDECPSVELTDEQIGRAVKLAEQKETKIENYHSFDVPHRSYVGFAGELAFVKYYDLELDIEYIPSGGDEGFDYEVWSDKLQDTLTIDIKTRTYPQADLLIQKSKYDTLSEKDNLPDAYCLIEKRLNLFGIVGFIWSHEVTDFDIYANQFPVANYFINREDLSPPPDPEEFTSIDNQIDNINDEFLEE